MEKTALLRTVPMFSNLSKAHLNKIAEIADEIEVKAGEVLVREGEKGTQFFYILEGKAKIVKDEKIPQILTTNNFFGEVSIIDGKPCAATVIAETGMRLLIVQSQYFWTLVEKTPTLANALMLALCRRLREGYNQYWELAEKQRREIS